MTAAPPYGQVWSSPAQRLSELLDGGGANHETLRAALALGYFSQYTAYQDPAFVSRVIDWQIDLLAARFGKSLERIPADLTELPIVPSPTLALRFERQLTPDLLRNIWYAGHIEETLGWGKNRALGTVLEIGSGYGCLARALKSLHPQCRLWLLDLTESLRIAQIYLQAHFPDARIAVVEDDARSADLDQADFVLMPIERAGLLAARRFDLAVNIWSFGEMPNAFVRNWFDLIQRQALVDSLYTLNAFMAPVTHLSTDRANQGDWLFQLDAGWDIRCFEVDPAIHRCPDIRNFYSGIAIAAQRLGDEVQLQALKKAAQTQAFDVSSQDWTRLLPSQGDMSVTRMLSSTEYIGHFEIAGGSGDPLFRLWNDFRLNGTPESGALLVAYLSMVSKTDLQRRCTKEEIQLLRRLPKSGLHGEYKNLLEKPEAAIEHLDKTYTVQQACDLALSLRAAGNLRQAEELFVKVACVSSRHGDAWYYLALISQSQGRRLMAAVCASHACRLAPNYEHYSRLRTELCTQRRSLLSFFRLGVVARTKVLIWLARTLLAAHCVRAAVALSCLAFLRSQNGAYCFPGLATALRAEGAVTTARSFELAAEVYER